MADHPDITPAELDEAVRIFGECGSYTETARRMGRSEAGIRQALRRHRDTKRHDAHTRALARAERKYRRALATNLDRIEKRLKNADKKNDDKAFVDNSKALHDGLRTLSQVRTAHAKIVGDHAPEKHDVTSGGAPLTIYAPEEREP
jgi:uncharacterized membrane protein YccC